MAEIGRRAYETPLFDSADPLVCHSLALRPSVWEAVWTALENMGQTWSWRQGDPTHETPETVALEVTKAVDAAVFMGCMMIGDVKTVARDAAAWELVCDGSVYLKTDYPLLWAAIDPAYETDGTHFRVPDLLDRFILGGTSLGDSGGESSHVLTIAEIPSHNHVEQDPGSVNAQAGVGAVALSDPGLPSVTGSTGGGGAHNNMPPYETLLPVIIARYPYA